MSSKKVILDCTLWLEESGLFLGKWEKTLWTKSLRKKGYREKYIQGHWQNVYRWSDLVQFTLKTNLLNLWVSWVHIFTKHTVLEPTKSWMEISPNWSGPWQSASWNTSLRTKCQRAHKTFWPGEHGQHSCCKNRSFSSWSQSYARWWWPQGS